jgi:HSP20 family protein
MSALTRLERLDDLFPEMFRRFARPMQLSGDFDSDMRIDVSENEKEYLVTAEIPGAKKDDIRVVVDGNYVSISAEIKKEIEDKHAENGRALLKETYRGSMQRGFTLASDIDDKNVTAKLEDGVLRLTLPKRAGTSSRLVPIN